MILIIFITRRLVFKPNLQGDQNSWVHTLNCLTLPNGSLLHAKKKTNKLSNINLCTAHVCVKKSPFSCTYVTYKKNTKKTTRVNWIFDEHTFNNEIYRNYSVFLCYFFVFSIRRTFFWMKDREKYLGNLFNRFSSFFLFSLLLFSFPYVFVFASFLFLVNLRSKTDLVIYDL